MSGQTESKFFQTINQEEVKVGSQKEGGYKGIGRRLEAGSQMAEGTRQVQGWSRLGCKLKLSGKPTSYWN